MSEHDKLQGRFDRRSFLKLLGSAGVTASIVSVGNPLSVGSKFSVSPPLGPRTAHVSSEEADNLLAQLPKDLLLRTYQRMVASRKWETTFKDLFVGGKDGLYGSFHMYIGEEAIANGVVAALNADDFIVSTHRGHGHLIAKGGDLNKMSAEIFFKATGYNHAYGGSMHITDVSKGILGMNGIVGASWYIGAGAACSIQVRQTKQVAVSFAGEGATNSVYFFSAIRNAALYKLPYIQVIENNQYNISQKYRNNTPLEHVSDNAKGLGIPLAVVDGNDVAAVYAAAKAAVDRARAGEGPSVIEALTYRWYDHSGVAGAKVGVDGAFGLPYRPDSEVRDWMAKEPIARFKAFLLGKQLATESELAKIEADTQKAVDDSIEFARNSADPDPKSGLTHVFATGEVEATQFFNGAQLAETTWSGWESPALRYYDYT